MDQGLSILVTRMLIPGARMTRMLIPEARMKRMPSPAVRMQILEVLPQQGNRPLDRESDDASIHIPGEGTEVIL